MFSPKPIICNKFNHLLTMIDDYELVNKVEYQNRKRTIIKYVNVPASFDIEVSSFRVSDVKLSCMYIWQFGINGYVYYARTWEDFIKCMHELITYFELGQNRRFVIYVHNLAYEFQFIRSMFEWESVFAREKRSPMYARTVDGLEFRCSYVLSGASLEQTCKDLQKYKVEKQVGLLDYNKIRTPETPLTDDEIKYSIYDVTCVMNYIKEEMEQYDNDITKIPLTKTGKVRLRCRNALFNKQNRTKYVKLMNSLTINDVKEYEMLKRSFQGGFTHASWLNVGKTLDNVSSNDFTSSYPTVMISEYYPMSKGEYTFIKDEETLKSLTKDNLVIFNIHFAYLKPKFNYEHYLSVSKCWRWNEENNTVYLNEKSKNVEVDNGRIISGTDINVSLTNIDYEIIKECYDFEADFGHGYVYKKGYLPKEYVSIIIDLYKKKTELKGVDGKEQEYMLAKADVNSLYGMMVTDIINDDIIFTDDWEKIASSDDDKEELIERYNENKKRFLFYPWGVFVTAYARRNLWSGIFELKDDYIYSDTDSVKYLNKENHVDYFNAYNEWITKRLEEACKYHGFELNSCRPKTIKGVEKPLGVWDEEDEESPIGKIYARRFKTLGAKRYLVEHYNKDKWEIKCTIAGVNKKKTSEWFNTLNNAFEVFENELTINADACGRLISTYIDTPFEADVTDYLGNKYHVKELSGLNMEKSEYNLTMTDIYLQLINSTQIINI